MKAKQAFPHGMQFDGFEGEPRGPVQQAPVTDRVFIPLQQGCDGPVQPCVNEGDVVACGQVIARDSGDQDAPIHSSIGGKIVEVVPPGPSSPGLVVIERGDSAPGLSVDPLAEAFAELPPQQVAAQLFEAGVASMTRYGIPTHRNPRGADVSRIDTLLVAALDTGVLAASPAVWMRERIEDAATGVRVVAHALGVGQVQIVVDEEDADFAAAWESALADAANVQRAPGDYPLHWDEVLTEAVTGRRVPDGGQPADAGVVCIDVPTALAACDAVIRGRPVTEQVVVLGGPGYGRPGIVRAPIGMRVADLVRPRLRDGIEVRLVEGGLLSGPAIDPGQRAVTRDLRRVDAVPEDREREPFAFLSPGRDRHSYGRSYLSYWRPADALRCGTNLQGEERPCISCGACDDVCPRGLLPYWLSRKIRAEQIGKADQFGLRACIECGLCSYVCPSKIPLMDDIARGKKRAAGKGGDYA